LNKTGKKRLNNSAVYKTTVFILYGSFAALQKQNTEVSKQIFPEKEYRGLSPNFHIHTSESDLYIPTIGLPILLEEIAHRHMNVEIGAEAALFPEKGIHKWDFRCSVYTDAKKYFIADGEG
jgi:hypothetical protein